MNENMSLLKASDLVEGHEWRTRALRTLLTYLPWNTNVITLPSDLYTSAADKRQFNAALQYLGNNNIAIRITKNNTKGISVPYIKNSWILNPKIVYVPENYELDCIIWKSMSGNEP